MTISLSPSMSTAYSNPLSGISHLCVVIGTLQMIILDLNFLVNYFDHCLCPIGVLGSSSLGSPHTLSCNDPQIIFPFCLFIGPWPYASLIYFHR